MSNSSAESSLCTTTCLDKHSSNQLMFDRLPPNKSIAHRWLGIWATSIILVSFQSLVSALSWYWGFLPWVPIVLVAINFLGSLGILAWTPRPLQRYSFCLAHAPQCLVQLALLLACLGGHTRCGPTYCAGSIECCRTLAMGPPHFYRYISCPTRLPMGDLPRHFLYHHAYWTLVDRLSAEPARLKIRIAVAYPAPQGTGNRNLAASKNQR